MLKRNKVNYSIPLLCILFVERPQQQRVRAIDKLRLRFDLGCRAASLRIHALSAAAIAVARHGEEIVDGRDGHCGWRVVAEAAHGAHTHNGGAQSSRRARPVAGANQGGAEQQQGARRMRTRVQQSARAGDRVRGGADAEKVKRAAKVVRGIHRGAEREEVAASECGAEECVRRRVGARKRLIVAAAGVRAREHTRGGLGGRKPTEW